MRIKQNVKFGLIIFSVIFLLAVMFEVFVYSNSTLSIVPASVTDTNDKFSQLFVVSNQGVFDAIDVGIWMDIFNVIDMKQQAYGDHGLLTQVVKQVKAKQSVTLDSTILFPPTKTPIHKMDIQIEVLYRPSYFPFRKARHKYQYAIERNNDGTVSWRQT